MPVAVSVRGSAVVEKVGSVGRKLVRLDANGAFEVSLTQGKYRLRLLNAKAGRKRLSRREHVISPPQFTVSQEAASVYFFVQHRDRPEPIVTGVSDGCEVR